MQVDEQWTNSVDISFVILTWNSERYLYRCLQSIEEALLATGLSYEVLLLDNGSRDATPDLIRSYARERAGRIIAVFESVNTGTTRSRNKLLTKARGDYICVMDSDVELAPGVVETLIRTLRLDGSLGIVVPRIVYPSGKWQKSYDRFPTILDKVHRFFRLRAIEHEEATGIAKGTIPFYVDYAISAFWLFRRGLLDIVGLLDERIYYAPEDVDFCLRAWNSGLRVAYVPTVTVVHDSQEISRGFKISRAKLSHVKGLGYFFAKHGYCLRRPRFVRPETLEFVGGAANAERRFHEGS